MTPAPTYILPESLSTYIEFIHSEITSYVSAFVFILVNWHFTDILCSCVCVYILKSICIDLHSTWNSFFLDMRKTKEACLCVCMQINIFKGIPQISAKVENKNETVIYQKKW